MKLKSIKEPSNIARACIAVSATFFTRQMSLSIISNLVIPNRNQCADNSLNYLLELQSFKPWLKRMKIRNLIPSTSLIYRFLISLGNLRRSTNNSVNFMTCYSICTLTSNFQNRLTSFNKSLLMKVYQDQKQTSPRLKIEGKLFRPTCKRLRWFHLLRKASLLKNSLVLD